MERFESLSISIVNMMFWEDEKQFMTPGVLNSFLLFIEVRTFVRSSVRCLQPDVDVARDFPPTLVLWQRVTRTAASILHRLRANCAFTKRTLHVIDRSDTLM